MSRSRWDTIGSSGYSGLVWALPVFHSVVRSSPAHTAVRSSVNGPAYPDMTSAIRSAW